MHFICEGLNVENTRRGCPRMLAGAPGRGVKGGMSTLDNVRVMSQFTNLVSS